MMDYQARRLALLVELRLIRRTKPARRVVKHMQRQMRKLRTWRRLMQQADGPAHQAERLVQQQGEQR